MPIIPKPSKRKSSRQDIQLMRESAEKHGKSVKQRLVRQDNCKFRHEKLPLNMYDTDVIQEPLVLERRDQGEQENEEPAEPLVPEDPEQSERGADPEVEADSDGDDTIEYDSSESDIDSSSRNYFFWTLDLPYFI